MSDNQVEQAILDRFSTVLRIPDGPTPVFANMEAVYGIVGILVQKFSKLLTIERISTDEECNCPDLERFARIKAICQADVEEDICECEEEEIICEDEK